MALPRVTLDIWLLSTPLTSIRVGKRMPLKNQKNTIFLTFGQFFIAAYRAEAHEYANKKVGPNV